MTLNCQCLTTVPHLTHPSHDCVGEAGSWRPAVIARMCILRPDGEVERENGGAVHRSNAPALHWCQVVFNEMNVSLQRGSCCAWHVAL